MTMIATTEATGLCWSLALCRSQHPTDVPAGTAHFQMSLSWATSLCPLPPPLPFTGGTDQRGPEGLAVNGMGQAAVNLKFEP